MSEQENRNSVRTRIWREEPEPDNPFAAKAAYCRGYDVYGEMLGHARWVDMLYLLFHNEAPTEAQANTLEALAVALINPGPRDPSVHAAMCGGVCGSTAAASLMAALAVGAGQYSGGREVYLAMDAWGRCSTDMSAWQTWLSAKGANPGSIWPDPDHPPGFDPYGVRTSTTVRQTLSHVVHASQGPRLSWLIENIEELESKAGYPVSMSGVAAATLSDLGFTPEQGEMVYLWLRLPGAAAHALEQRPHGYKKFPFGSVELESDGAREEA